MAAAKSPAVRWALSLYTKSPTSLPLLDSDPSSSHAIVFVAGLTDTFGTVPYLERLANGVAALDCSVVQLQLSSSLGGWGYCSLEGDAQEISKAISYLRQSQGKDKIILMGHSTGCQDTMAYLSCPGGSKARGEGAIVDGAILQAPVADRESWEHDDSGGPEDRKDAKERLEMATKLVDEGKGYQILPRTVKPQPKPNESTGEQVGNVGAADDPPMTAYRFWSLFSKGGDDDCFATDLGLDSIRNIWLTAGRGLRADGPGYVLSLIGQEDEFIPRPALTPESILKTWTSAVEQHTSSRCRFEVLKGANHKVDAAEPQMLIVGKAREMLRALGVTPKKQPQAATQSPQATPASASALSRPSTRGPPPPLPKGIPAWQLADEQKEASAVSNATEPPSTTSSSSSVPPHPPSFDALVELIATGRTDEIEGIRDIPLHINEEKPTESKLDAPRKPWESGL